jgi:ferrous iron transport protein A
MTLNDLRPGERAIIQHLSAATPVVRQRLLELGMTKGSMVELMRVAPLGDPLEVRIKGYRLSLRKREAESVVVRKENTGS